MRGVMRPHEILRGKVEDSYAMVDVWGRRWTEALAIFAALPVAKIAANVITYGAAMSACEKAAQWQKAAVPISQSQECQYFIALTCRVCTCMNRQTEKLRHYSCLPAWKAGSFPRSWILTLYWSVNPQLWQVHPEVQPLPRITSLSAMYPG